MTRFGQRGVYDCMDCRADTLKEREFYMVHRHVRLRAVPELHGMLCIGCLESRLGRKLERDDFLPKPINISDDQLERLRDRLGDFTQRYAGAIMDELSRNMAKRVKMRRESLARQRTRREAARS